LLNSGYQANTSLITALLGSRDAIFSDSLNHASIIDGCRMARAKGTQLFIFDHLNLDHLNLLLSDWHKKRTQGALALVVTDAVFSMDGDLANLQALLSLCNDFDALLMVDEAHATGLLGESGAGLVEYQGIKGYVPVIMGTLGKALGSFGAFVCGDSLLTDHLINTCRGFIFSTALPAPVVASALKAVEIAQTECWRRLKALENARIIREALGQKRSDSAIISVLIGDNGQTLQEAARLRAHGFDIRAIRPPTVPEGTARLRITTNALQQEKDIKALIQLLLPHNESGL
jgi:7-keto-8-aminopelargonate synthetase-like enzyme